jgi:hypothetical protein
VPGPENPSHDADEFEVARKQRSTRRRLGPVPNQCQIRGILGERRGREFSNLLVWLIPVSGSNPSLSASSSTYASPLENWPKSSYGNRTANRATVRWCCPPSHPEGVASLGMPRKVASDEWTCACITRFADEVRSIEVHVGTTVECSVVPPPRTQSLMPSDTSLKRCRGRLASILTRREKRKARPFTLSGQSDAVKLLPLFSGCWRAPCNT